MDAFTSAKLAQCGVDRRRIDDMNISELDLSGQNLSAVDLKGFLITRVNLENSDLSGADLRSLDFAQTNCVGAKFMGADLRGASLAFGYFNTADFSGADFRGAHLENGLCSECVFSGADLRGARLGSEHYNSDFRGADLRGVVAASGSEFEKLNCDIRGALTTPPRVEAGTSNKRILPRIHPQLQLNVFDRASKRQVGVVADISLDGLRITSRSAIPGNLVIGMDVMLPEGSKMGICISCEARSIWTSPQQGTPWFNSGFRIERISEEHRGIIQAIMKEQEIR
jgi:uncharacterized protein YjbI with pentapeptide repeats